MQLFRHLHCAESNNAAIRSHSVQTNMQNNDRKVVDKVIDLIDAIKSFSSKTQPLKRYRIPLDSELRWERTHTAQVRSLFRCYSHINRQHSGYKG